MARAAIVGLVCASVTILAFLAGDRFGGRSTMGASPPPPAASAADANASVRRALFERLDRDVQARSLRTSQDLDAYLAQLRDQAGRRGSVSIEEVYSGRRAIQTMGLPAEESLKRQLAFRDELRRIGAAPREN